ncbi:MAG: DNA repair protein RecO, partial [Candidatus Komeilibacteria bacterium]|nr:DNA repair protein RecO [Candidatus Komeilibacteria bacterium]
SMATYKTRAIILSSYPYREHDRIVTFFSADYGRMEARARGTRKLESKLAGHLEPFIETELLLARGRHWDILAGSRTVRPMALIRSQLELTAAASLCVEAVKLITKPLSAERAIWQELTRTLTILEDEGYSLIEKKGAAVAFLWKLIALGGFTPELSRCIKCRHGVESGVFSCEGGGMLCPNCQSHDLLAAPLSAEALVDLRLNRMSKSQDLADIVIAFWRQVVDYTELRSWNFFRAVL